MSALAEPLIQTKLEAPVPRRLVARDALLAWLLDNERSRRLTLVLAPAGSGKTTLLAEWGASPFEKRPFAWLALDSNDNEPTLFWSYLIAALRTVAPGLGARPLALLRAPGVDLRREMLPRLINEIAALPERIVLVLDDYHLITDPEVHAGMSQLVEHLPARLEIVVASRTEPDLPLARLRVRGELDELDGRALSFSEEEATELLNGLQGLDLRPEDVTRLRARTEGWPAGLFLAALSLRDRADPGSFIDDFAGDDRHVVDYLAAEVLSGQSVEVRRFLLRTCVTERLCAPLCDVLTGRSDSARVLDEIARSNLFLVPLDTRGEWHRYHHLFGELLRHELSRDEPELVAELHRRAASWFLESGLVSEAVRHTTAAGDLGDASALIAQHWAPTLLGAAGDRTVDAWLSALPEHMLRADVRLCFARCFVSLSLGRMDEVERWLAIGEGAPQAGPFLDGVSGAEGALACVRAAWLWETGDVGGAIEAGREAREAERGLPWEAIGVAVIGLAHAARGEWAEGRSNMAEYARIGSESGHHLNHASGLCTASACHAELGQWDEAARTAEAGLEIAVQHGIDEHWCTSHAHLARALALEQRGELEQAEAELERSVQLARRGSGPVYTAWPLLHLGRVRDARHDHPAARTAFDEARAELASARDGGILPERLAEAEAAMAARGREVAPGEPLSERELAVLKLLAGELSQREIGRELYLSLNTVKTHCRNIFRKLDVTSRKEAVERARERGLL